MFVILPVRSHGGHVSDEAIRVRDVRRITSQANTNQRCSLRVVVGAMIEVVNVELSLDEAVRKIHAVIIEARERYELERQLAAGEAGS